MKSLKWWGHADGGVQDAETERLLAASRPDGAMLAPDAADRIRSQALAASGPVAPTQVELLVEIRDLLRAEHGQRPGADPSGPGTTTLP